MLNLFRADIYRIIRGKALYITLAVLLAFNLLMIITLNIFQTGVVDLGYDDELAAAAMAEIQAMSLDGVRVPEILTGNMENLVFFLLPLIIIVAAVIFSHGTVKNDIAWGLSRTKLYMSKLLLSFAFSFLLLLAYIGTGMLVATMLNGFGAPAPDGHWVNLLQVLGAQLFMLLAMVSIGVFLVFTTKRVAAVNGIFIAFILVPALVIALLELANPDLSWLYDFDMTYNINRLANLRYLETREILQALGLGMFYLLATTIGGMVLFRRAEIK